MRTHPGLLLLAAFGLALVGCGDDDGPRLYRGGPILTLDAENRVVEAVGIADGRIAAVGSEAELADWVREAQPAVVDLEGRALLPGFIDAHGHYPGEGISAVFVDLNSPPIGSVERMDDLVALLAARAEETPAGDWVVGLGYDDTLLEERRHPDAPRSRPRLHRAPDRDHPRLGTSERRERRGSRRARHRAGDAGPGRRGDPARPRRRAGRRSRRDGHGRHEDRRAPVARRDPHHARGRRRAVPRERRDDRAVAAIPTERRGADDATDWMSRLGVIVPVRLVVWPSVPEDVQDSVLDGELELRSTSIRRGYASGGRREDRRRRFDPGIHGIPRPNRIIALRRQGADPDYRGFPRDLARGAVRARSNATSDAGLQIAVHGNGDASIDDILDAYEAGEAENPRRSDARHVVVHAQMARAISSTGWPSSA